MWFVWIQLFNINNCWSREEWFPKEDYISTFIPNKTVRPINSFLLHLQNEENFAFDSVRFVVVVRTSDSWRTTTSSSSTPSWRHQSFSWRHQSFSRRHRQLLESSRLPTSRLSQTHLQEKRDRHFWRVRRRLTVKIWICNCRFSNKYEKHF